MRSISAVASRTFTAGTIISSNASPNSSRGIVGTVLPLPDRTLAPNDTLRTRHGCGGSGSSVRTALAVLKVSSKAAYPKSATPSTTKTATSMSETVPKMSFTTLGSGGILTYCHRQTAPRPASAVPRSRYSLPYLVT